MVGEEMMEEPPGLTPRCPLRGSLVRRLRWKTLKMMTPRPLVPLDLLKSKRHLIFGLRKDVGGSFNG
jgi:hypothetical protein